VSRWAGVQVGIAVPRSFGSDSLTVDEILDGGVRLGLSAIELCGHPVETLLGVPALPAISMALPEDAFESGLHPLEEEVLQDELELARTTFSGRRQRWRGAVSLGPLAALRRRYEAAGVRIEIVHWDGLVFLSDEEVDYGFRLAAALGARALSTDLVIGGPRRLGPFAERHRMWIGFRGNRTTDAAELEAAFSHGTFNGATFALGDWVAGGHGSPLPFLEQHAGRITQVHLDDRQADGASAPFGHGVAPIRELLAEMRAHQWPFQATIAMAEAAPDRSTRMEEIANAIDYCRSCLTA
jgi:hypothetical protein